MAKTKALASDFDSLLGQTHTETSKVSIKTETKVDEVQKTKGRPPTKGNDTQTTFYYPKAWRKRLKEQALHEDISVNDLIIEGIKLMFEKRGIDINS